MKNIKTFESYGKIQNSDIDRASEIIGKSLDDNNALSDITNYIESNISNKSMEKQIDELTDIKRNLKN